MAQLSVIRAFSQLNALSFRLKLWLAWMTLTTLVVPLVFLSEPFFAALMVCQAGNLVFGGWLMLRYGLVKLLSLAHVLFWTPMIGKFIWYYETLAGFNLYLAIAVITTVVASLVLDFRDYFAWRRGDHAPMV